MTDYCEICGAKVKVLYASELGWVCECDACGTGSLVGDEEIEELATRERNNKEEAQ